MKLKAIARIQAAAAQPTPKDAAKQIEALFAKPKKEWPREVRLSPEPYRAAAYHLGWEQYDGTPWWDKVMDILS